MKPIGATLVCLLATAGTARAQLPQDTHLAAPIQFKSLTILPLIKQANPLAQKAQYLTLADGLARKQVDVSERKEGASVNQVLVANKSDRSLLLLGGEVILGGQQDRIIGKDTIIEPHEQRTVGVFCVEHGRWNGARQFTNSGGLAEGKMRVRAKYRGNQQEVWDEVAKKNAALGAAQMNQTGTYRKLAAGAEGEKAMKAYREAIGGALDKLPDKKKLVGVIAAINGRVTSVDIFQTPELFASYKDKLLDSIYITAADVPVTDGAKRAPSAGDVGAFIMKVEAAPAEVSIDAKNARTTEKKAKDAAGSTVEDKRAPAAAPVYKSYQANE
jgi:ARG/rhodanese/phosphatase superfamily protein